MFVSMSTPRSIYVIYFHCYFPFQNNHIIPLKQTIVFCTFYFLLVRSSIRVRRLAFAYFLANFNLVLPVKVLLVKVYNEALTFCWYLRDKKSRKTLLDDENWFNYSWRLSATRTELSLFSQSPVSGQCSHSIPPESIWKSVVFRYFRGYRKARLI